MPSNLSVKSKLYSLMFLSVAGALTVLILVVYSSYNSMLESRKKELKHLIESAYSTIELNFAAVQAGHLTESEAQRKALDTLSGLRYDGSNYFWVNDFQPHVVMHPIKPELNGKDVSGLKDPNGKALFVAFVDKVNAEGEGIVDYYWPKPNFKDPVAKFSYVKGFKPWGWILGTGAYVDDINAEFQSTLLKALGIVILITALLVWASLRIIRDITQPLSTLVGLINRVAQTGDLSQRALLHQRDELGQVAGALNKLFARWQEIINESVNSVASLANGDFGHPVTTECEGDTARLKAHINDSLASVKSTMQAINERMADLAGGHVSKRQAALSSPRGEFARTLQLADEGMLQMQTSILAISTIMHDVQQGRMDQTIQANLPGELADLKQVINESLGEVSFIFNALIEGFRKISEGDLKVDAHNDYEGDFKQLKGHLIDTAQALAEIAEQVVDDSRRLASDTSQLSTAARNLSSRTDKQAATLDQTTQSVQQLQEEVLKTAAMADNTRKVSDLAIKEAEDSLQVSSETLIAMESIRQSSLEVNNIISVINEIAFQTNLLALNASVEAARAGEQGRGFAVVASEVRNLAQRSAAAAKSINELIHTAVTKIDDGADKVNRMAACLHGITKQIGDANAKIAGVSDSNRVQTDKVREIMERLNQLKEMTHQNNQMAEASAAASESIDMRAASLQNKVGFFKI